MKQRVEKKDLYDFHLLSALKTSPQGKRLAYVHTQMIEQEDSYDKSIWLMESSHSLCVYQKQPFTCFIWEDEDTLLIQKPYAKDKSEFVRLHLSDLHVSDAFALPYHVVNIQKIKQGVYAFLAETSIQKNNEDDTIVLTQIPFWNNGEGYISGKRNHLYVYYEDTGNIQSLLADHWSVEHLAVSDTMIACSAQEYTSKKAITQGIYAFALDDLQKREVLGTDCMRVDDIVCEKDHIVFTATDMKQYGNEEAADFYHWTSQNGMEKVKESEHYAYCDIVTDCHVGSSTSMILKDDVLYYVKSMDGFCRMYALHMNGEETCITPQGNVVRDIALCDQGWYTLEADAGLLEEIYMYEDGVRKQCTQWNTSYCESHEIIQAEEILFTNGDQQQIKGWILYPYGYEAGRKYPGLLSIHGGPRGAYGNVFVHEMQMFAAMGYMVFYTNPRGSDTFGEAYADLRGKYGTIDYEDLMAFTDAVLQKIDDLDAGRLGVLGGSYGGFMTNWIIGHTDRFAAAASQRSVANWISDFGTSCIGYTFDPNEMQTTPWQDMQKMWQASPLAYADRAVTPTLFIHSLEDYNCPLSEGLQMFTALQFHGVDSRMCLFPQENHELSRSGKPKHRLRRLQEMADWFETYLK